MEQSNLKAQLFVLMGAVLWGTTGSAQALAPSNASPIVIGALRMAIGGTALFLIALIKGSFKSKIKLDKKIVLIASFCMAVYQPLFFMGVSKTGVAFGTVLGIGSAPVFSGIIDNIFGKKPNIKWIIATIVSIIGCILLLAGQDPVDMNLLGSFLSLGAGLSYATYVTASRKLFQEAPRASVNGCVFLLSAAMLFPILLVNDLRWVVTIRGFAMVSHLGLVATALAYTLFAKGLVFVPASKAVTLTLAEPLTAFMLGILLLKENVTFISAIGVLVLFSGLIINSFPDKTEDKEDSKLIKSRGDQIWNNQQEF